MQNHDRRRFLATSLSVGAALAAGRIAHARFLRPGPEPQKSLRLLVLGGTSFIGPVVVETALARGHKVTVFNRGITESRKGRLADEVTRLVGDRDPNKGEGLTAIQKVIDGADETNAQMRGGFDCVIDTSGYYPRHVAASADLLAKTAKHYVFVSSISAYKDNSKSGQDESAELAVLDDPAAETMGDQFQNYGGLKVLCEQAVTKAFGPSGACIVRPGFIVGPGDNSDRFTYWPVRYSRGGEMIWPNSTKDPLQVIDVRDLGEWLVRLIEEKTVGTFNALGPASPSSFGELLECCRDACALMFPSTVTTPVWLSEDFLTALQQPIDLPLWAPSKSDFSGMHGWSNARAVKAGLTFRDLHQTTEDTLRWWPSEAERRARVTNELVAQAQAKAKTEGKEPPPPPPGDPRDLRAGLPADAEKQILNLFHNPPPASQPAPPATAPAS